MLKRGGEPSLLRDKAKVDPPCMCDKCQPKGRGFSSRGAHRMIEGYTLGKRECGLGGRNTNAHV
jgi:hypothetical protein